MNILIADDEQRIRRLVCDFLKKDGHHMLEAGDGQEAVRLFDENQNRLDLVILDVMMPYFDGWAVLRHIKEKSPGTAVMMLTARGEDTDEVLGFDLGADDYVTKPFSPMVLAARVRAVEKRRAPADAGGKTERIGSLTIDEARRSIQVGGKNVELTPKEYELLIYLKDNKNIALSRESILNAVWGYDYFGDVRSVDTHIKKLRAKLGEEEGKRIETVRGYGYRFEG